MGRRRPRAARARDRARGRRRRERDLRRRQAEGERRGRHPPVRPPPRRRTRRTTRSARSSTSSTPTPTVNGILLQLPTPPQVDGAQLTTEILPGKDVDGLTPISTGLLVKGLPGPAPVHAERVHGAAAPPRRAARGRRGGRRRAQRPRRQADRRDAAGRQRDRHHVPLAHPRPRRTSCAARTS